ncbi:MAG: ACT domain-containing protein [Oscillospiraceae bacterium]|nr:ACT domain-containing protein [Oscillospiraceae bacterium]
MTANQLSIFMENKPGQLVKVTEELKETGIDIRAMSLADTKDFGIVRMIVSDIEKAQTALKARGFMSTITKVLCVAMNDTPGGLSAVTQLLAEAEVNIDYLYACITVVGKDAYIVMHVDNEKKAAEILTAAGVKLVSDLQTVI